MPPKKGKGKGKAPPAPPKPSTIWAWEDDKSKTGWSFYSAEDCAKIQKGYDEGFKTVSIGDYLVNTKMMQQVHRRDQTRVRKISKRPAADGPAPPSSEPTVTVHNVDDDDELAAKKPKKEEPKKAPAAVAKPVTPPAPVVPAAEVETEKEDDEETEPDVPLSLTRATSSMFAVIDARGVLTTDKQVGKVVESVLHHTPTINRMSLSQAATKMYRHTRRWLNELGRAEGEKGVFITMNKPLEKMKPQGNVNLSKTFSTTVGTMQRLAKEARLTHVCPKPNPLLLPCRDAHHIPPLTAPQHLETQLMMISGPALLLYDGNYDPLPNPPEVYVASIPGINFGYCQTDADAFTEKPFDEDTGLPKARRINRDAALRRMEQIWGHVATVMDECYGVEYGVMCAIGCGAFRGTFGARVPQLWGCALVMALSKCNLKNMKAVFVTLPTFGDDRNFAPFKSGVESAINQYKTSNPERFATIPPIVLVEDASMVSMAVQISSLGKKVGILNPSDVQALRHGWIGMYWDGGHIALEEVLAMQTTILLQHVGLNRQLYTQSNRQIQVNL